MRRIITVLLVAFLLTGFSWFMKNSPGWAQEQPKQLTQAQRLDRTLTNLLDWKARYGLEVQRAAAFEVEAIRLSKLVNLLGVELKKIRAELKALKVENEDDAGLKIPDDD